MYGEIAEVRGYARGIHQFGFAVASFTWLYAQAATPALSWQELSCMKGACFYLERRGTPSG
jgi:hypothetical protein